MAWVFGLLGEERQARRFFLAYAQSALGTGAAYVALLLVAYERFHSPWALSLVLLAEIAPPMLLGPLFGAAVDRWSRRGAAIVADATRALAFTGIVLTHSFAATVLLALVAGVGTSLWKPAIMASLPTVVSRRRLPEATALYGALTEIGYTVGPGLAAVVLLFAGPNALLGANAASFAISAALLSTLAFGARPAHADERVQDRLSLLGEARHGIGVAAHTPVVRTVIVATSSILFFGGIINVSELLLSNQLGAGRIGYSLLVTVSGVGIATGSLIGKSGGSLQLLQRRFLGGLALFAVGLVGASASPIFGGVTAGIALAGIGNGMLIVFQRLILQASVDDGLLGRVFGVQVALDAAAFTSSYLVAGALLTVAGPRTMFVVAAVGAVAVATASAWALRAGWRREVAASGATPAVIPEPEPAEALAAVGGGSELG
jgi:MFS family permease